MTPTDRDMVTITEGGQRLGLTNLRAYRARYPGFPDPAPYTGGRLWRMSEIRSWYEQAVTPRQRKDT